MAKEPTEPKKQSDGAAKQLAFDYIKSPHFRALRADGAIGGVTPNGQIHIALYSERPPIPQRVVHRITEENKLGEEIEHQRVSRDAIVREMDADVFLTLRPRP